VRLAREMELADPAAIAIAARYLARRGLRVSAPRLTQALEIDLNGDGQWERFVCAESEPAALHERRGEAIYSVALMEFTVGGHSKTDALAEQTSYRPASETAREHKQFYGVMEHDQLLAFVDLDGDGRLEIALYRHIPVAVSPTEAVDLFKFDGKNVRKVLAEDTY